MLNAQYARNLWGELVDSLKAETPLYWLTMVLALAGAKLTSGPIDDSFNRGLGFAIWIISNGLLLYHFTYKERKPTMIFMYLVYEYYNVVGMINNWF